MYYYLLSETHDDHQDMWTKAQDQYYLSILDTGLNQMHLKTKELKEKNDKQFTEWLSKEGFEEY